MSTLNPKIDQYLAEGCGRCKLGGTPQCKVHQWHEELETLRNIVLECGLVEELKWSHPCYTFEHTNVVILGAFKEYCVINFLKGVLLKDPHGILSMPGENSQSARFVRITSPQQVHALEAALKDYVREAIEIEKAGLKVTLKKTTEYEIPVELEEQFANNPALKTAFYALTPGRQRGYLLHFAAAKQSQTRHSRIEKYTPHILAGKGFND